MIAANYFSPQRDTVQAAAYLLATPFQGRHTRVLYVVEAVLFILSEREWLSGVRRAVVVAGTLCITPLSTGQSSNIVARLPRAHADSKKCVPMFPARVGFGESAEITTVIVTLSTFALIQNAFVIFLRFFFARPS